MDVDGSWGRRTRSEHSGQQLRYSVLAVYTGDSLLGLTPAIKSYPNNHAGNEARLNVAAGKPLIRWL